MSLLLRLLINTFVILLIAYFMPGFIVAGFAAAFLFALVLGVINAIIRPVIVLLTLPISILTIGLFTLVINAILFWVASLFVFGVHIQSFAAAFWGALLFSFASWITSALVRR